MASTEGNKKISGQTISLTKVITDIERELQSPGYVANLDKSALLELKGRMDSILETNPLFYSKGNFTVSDKSPSINRTTVDNFIKWLQEFEDTPISTSLKLVVKTFYKLKESGDGSHSEPMSSSDSITIKIDMESHREYFRRLERNNRHTDLTLSASSGDVEGVYRLLKSGADVNSTDSIGRTASLFSSARGYTKIIEMLVDLGADMNRPNNFDITPLSIAASNAHEGTIKLLLNQGAKIHQDDVNVSVSAFSMAFRHCSLEIVQLFIDHDAVLIENHYFPSDLFGYASLIEDQLIGDGRFGLIIDNGYDLGKCSMERNCDTRNSLNLISSAVQERVYDAYYEIILSMLEGGADVNVRDGRGYTPLHVHVWFYTGKGSRIVKLMIKHGADLSLKIGYIRVSQKAIGDRIGGFSESDSQSSLTSRM